MARIMNKEELLTKKIEELEMVIEVLKKIRDNPGMSEKRAIDEAEMDYSVFRRVVYDANWMKKKSFHVPVERTEKEVNELFKELTPTMCWQEILWCSVVNCTPNNIDLAPLDVVETIDWCLEDIASRSERYTKIRDVLLYVYRDGLNFTEVGEIYEVTGGRIGQIVAKGLRMMRYRGEWVRYGKKHCIDLKAMTRKLENDMEVSIRRKVLNEINGSIPVIRELVQKAIQENNDEFKKKELDEKLDKLIVDCDLSVRSTNCLLNAGINNVRKLLELTDHDIAMIRNLGRKSAEEVIDLLCRMGLRTSRDFNPYDE